MKLQYTLIFLFGLLCSCQTEVEVTTGNDTFEKNSATVMAYLNGYQNESLDYDALFSKDVIMLNTRIGAVKDSISIAEINKFGEEELFVVLSHLCLRRCQTLVNDISVDGATVDIPYRSK